MCHTDPYDKVPGSDVRGCRTSIVDHSSACICARPQSSREPDEEPSSKAFLYGGSTDVPQLSSLQRSSARRTRGARSSTRLCRCVCIGEARPCLGGRWSWMMCVHTYMIYQPSSSKADIRLGDRAARTGDHMRVFDDKVCRNWGSDLRRSCVGCRACLSKRSCHKDSG